MFVTESAEYKGANIKVSRVSCVRLVSWEEDATWTCRLNSSPATSFTMDSISRNAVASNLKIKSSDQIQRSGMEFCPSPALLMLHNELKTSEALGTFCHLYF